MLSATLGLLVNVLLAANAASTTSAKARADPCAAIAGQKWVAPSAARACLQYVDTLLRPI